MNHCDGSNSLAGVSGAKQRLGGEMILSPHTIVLRVIPPLPPMIDSLCIPFYFLSEEVDIWYFAELILLTGQLLRAVTSCFSA